MLHIVFMTLAAIGIALLTKGEATGQYFVLLGVYLYSLIIKWLAETRTFIGLILKWLLLSALPFCAWIIFREYQLNALADIAWLFAHDLWLPALFGVLAFSLANGFRAVFKTKKKPPGEVQTHAAE